MTRPSKAMLAILAAGRGTTARARSWWSLEISALEGIRDADPLYGPLSTLLMEDTSLLYGQYESAKDEDHVKYSPLVYDYSTWESEKEEYEGGKGEDAFVTYPTPQPSMHPTPFAMEQGQEGQIEQDGQDGQDEQEGQDGQNGQAGPPPSASLMATDVTTWMPTADPSPSGSGTSTDATAEPPVQLVGPFPAPPSASPAASPTASPATDRPTPEPSRQHEAANGGCPPGQSLHRLWLYDSAGDGWGSTRLVIEKRGAGAVFEGGLDAERGVVTYESEANIASVHGKERGDARLRRLGTSLARSFSEPNRTVANQFGRHPDGDVEQVSPHPSHGSREGANDLDLGGDEHVYLCLSRSVCYDARVSGGTFLEEVRWEITRVDLGDGENIGLVASGVGKGSGSCEFSLDNGCAETCDGEKFADEKGGWSLPTSLHREEQIEMAPEVYIFDHSLENRTVPSANCPMSRDTNIQEPSLSAKGDLRDPSFDIPFNFVTNLTRRAIVIGMLLVCRNGPDPDTPAYIESNRGVPKPGPDRRPHCRTDAIPLHLPQPEARLGVAHRLPAPGQGRLWTGRIQTNQGGAAVRVAVERGGAGGRCLAAVPRARLDLRERRKRAIGPPAGPAVGAGVVLLRRWGGRVDHQDGVDGSWGRVRVARSVLPGGDREQAGTETEPNEG